MLRYLRAAVTTLRLALRGEKPPHADLYAWMDHALTLVEAVDQAAGAAHVDTAALRVRVDGRDDSMALILKAVRYHTAEEYRHLLRHATSSAFNAIHASNFNDQYRIERLLAAATDPAVRAALTALRTHLDTLPTSDSRHKPD